MPSTDSSAIDAAVVQRMTGDTQLAQILTGGVFLDRAPKGATKYGIVSLLAHEDVGKFDEGDGGTAYERCLYLLKAVSLDTSSGDVDAAASRIKALFHLSDPTTFTPVPTGYGVMASTRVSRVREVEVDPDTDQDWQHAGGHYELLVQAT